MKFLSRVIWSEGMHLGPHHFQTQSRYFEDSLWFLSGNLRQNPWGLIHLSLDQEAIHNGSAILAYASGIFPDGLIFDLPGCDSAPPAVHLPDLFTPTDTDVILHLAIPSRRDHGLDCDPAPASGARYSPEKRSLRDETISEDESSVTFGRKNLVLCSQSQLKDSSVSIPVARILRDGRGGFVTDHDFIPPSLRIGANESLVLRLQRLVEAIEEKVAVVDRGKHAAGAFEAGTSALDVSNYWFLHALCSALPALRNHIASKRSHPEDVYHDLVKLAGALCTFSLDSDPSRIAPYDHRNLSSVFQALDLHIRRHLEIVMPSNCVTLQFERSDQFIYVAPVKDERCLRRARWIFGIRSDIGEANLLRLTPGRAKICSAEGVLKLVKLALPGMELTHIPVPPADLHAQADMHYFSISQQGPCWEHILYTRQVGLYLPQELGRSAFELTVILENKA
jgi:type VI secretion system protein ImpJ